MGTTRIEKLRRSRGGKISDKSEKSEPHCVRDDDHDTEEHHGNLEQTSLANPCCLVNALLATAIFTDPAGMSHLVPGMAFAYNH
jgi:hypothetical protein